MYDAIAVDEGMSDITACQYDGVEIGLEKVRANGPDEIDRWLDEYDLDLYCVMSEWLEDEETADLVARHTETIADLGGEFVGLLPPHRHHHDDATVKDLLRTVCDAAADAGVTPVLHHHGATAVEQPDEIREFLDVADNLQLLFDTAHYYPYSEHYPDGDVTEGIRGFADDIGYVHLKDVAPTTSFTENRDALTSGEFHLDNVINYFRSFTDLGEGRIDFEGVYEALEEQDYDGHYTIEIENRTERPLVHAKQNVDYWRDISASV